MAPLFRAPSACLVTLAATAAMALPAPAATADPTPPAAGAPDSASVADLLGQLRTLYRQTERETEAYQSADQKLRRQRSRTETLAKGLARARTELAEARAEAGAIAREQYRDGAQLSLTMRVLFSDDPQAVADQAHLLRRVANHQAGVLWRLTLSLRRADSQASIARKAFATQRELAERKKEHRDAARQRLTDVEGLLASLSDSQLAQVRGRERQDEATAQRALRASGALGHGPDPAPSTRGARAVRYAVRQLGKPYGWGSAGPAAFDCSGLTSRAWAQAGRRIPRTSQQQWRRLPRVSLRALRPGDLVVYRPNARHVALYAGDGRVVQAPHPGASVTLSPLATRSVLGAVRPDSGSPSGGRFEAPRPEPPDQRR